MANNKTADLTIKIGGIPVKGRVQTDLDTGNSKCYRCWRYSSCHKSRYNILRIKKKSRWKIYALAIKR
jgi:hypothetical protein